MIGLEAIDESWTRGRNFKGEVGIFPSSFCWSLDMDLLFKQKSGLGQVEKFAQVVHSMQVHKRVYLRLRFHILGI